MSAVLHGLVTGWAIAVPLGAVGTLLLLHSARSRLTAAVAATTGIATVDGGYALAAGLSWSVLGPWVKPLSAILTPVAAGALIWVAGAIVIRSLRPTSLGSGEGREFSAARSYWNFLGLTSINPLTLAYFAAVAAGGVRTIGSTRGVVGFTLGAFVGSFTGHLIWVACGVVLKPAVVTRGGRIVTSIVGSVVVTAIAIRMIAESLA